MLKRILALAALVSTCGIHHAIAGPTIQHWTTSHGTPVYFVESRGLPMLDVRVDFAAGSSLDPSQKAGLASMTHAMLDLGAGPDDEAAIAKKLADLGAQLGGSVDMDRASLSLRSLSSGDKLPAAMAVLRQIVSDPHFKADVFERERRRAIAELQDALTRPDTLASRAFWKTLYSNHPYGQLVDTNTLNALTIDDLKQFFTRYYTRGNAVITLVGDLDRAHAEKLSERLSGAIKPDNTQNAPLTLAVPSTAGDGQTVKIEHSASQAHVLIGLPAIERGNPDFFALQVGNYTLGGGGFVSRLMNEVREKRGFAYSVYSYFAPMRQPGPFQIGLQTKKSQANDALNVAREVLQKFVSDGPSDAELKAAKANLIGSFPLRLDSNKKLLENVAVIGFYGLPLDWLDTYQAKIATVSKDDVKTAFAKYAQPKHLHTIVVGAE